MKRFAKQIRHLLNDAKIVKVDHRPNGDDRVSRCWYNSLEFYKQHPNSRIVCGYIIYPADERSFRPDADAMMIPHYWNRLNGEYVETGPHDPQLDGGTYIVCRDQWVTPTDQAKWITLQDINYYCQTRGISPLTQQEANRVSEEQKELNKQYD
tara:strand:+ start:339 stop:797 length:459 start_codon:yes stop_codon:yes gene_type:complete